MKEQLIEDTLGVGGWGLRAGDWGLGNGDWANTLHRSPPHEHREICDGL